MHEDDLIRRSEALRLIRRVNISLSFIVRMLINCRLELTSVCNLRRRQPGIAQSGARIQLIDVSVIDGQSYFLDFFRFFSGKADYVIVAQPGIFRNQQSQFGNIAFRSPYDKSIFYGRFISETVHDFYFYGMPSVGEHYIRHRLIGKRNCI